MEKRPEWLKAQYDVKAVAEMSTLMSELSLNTVCNEANCPNVGECFKNRTATFMILGNKCTRNCRFCNVSCAKPDEVDPSEPIHVAEAVKKLGLKRP